MQKSDLNFLQDLSENNNREWFTQNKSEYEKTRLNFKSLFENWFQSMSSMDELEALKIFRIYRDVRFSKNKRPYKTHFSSSISRAKPHLRGGYYLEIGAQKSLIAAGFWGPEKEDLLRIRKEIEMDPDEFAEIIGESNLVIQWGELKGDGVKTAPKGFEKDTKGIEYIRKKQFVFSHEFDSNLVLQPDFQEFLQEKFRSIRPFFDYMSSVLTTNLNGESLID
ncbi:MAG: DUF2461 domain-containing protein [Flavobacteriaceae bacterium]